MCSYEQGTPVSLESRGRVVVGIGCGDVTSSAKPAAATWLLVCNLGCGDPYETADGSFLHVSNTICSRMGCSNRVSLLADKVSSLANKAWDGNGMPICLRVCDLTSRSLFCILEWFEVWMPGFGGQGLGIRVWSRVLRV